MRKEKARLSDRTEMRKLQWIHEILLKKYIKKEDVKRRAGIESIVRNVPKLWS
jgi:hypothetical protein